MVENLRVEHIKVQDSIQGPVRAILVEDPGEFLLWIRRPVKDSDHILATGGVYPAGQLSLGAVILKPPVKLRIFACNSCRRLQKFQIKARFLRTT